MLIWCSEFIVNLEDQRWRPIFSIESSNRIRMGMGICWARFHLLADGYVSFPVFFHSCSLHRSPLSHNLALVCFLALAHPVILCTFLYHSLEILIHAPSRMNALDLRSLGLHLRRFHTICRGPVQRPPLRLYLGHSFIVTRSLHARLACDASLQILPPYTCPPQIQHLPRQRLKPLLRPNTHTTPLHTGLRSQHQRLCL